MCGLIRYICMQNVKSLSPLVKSIANVNVADKHRTFHLIAITRVIHTMQFLLIKLIEGLVRNTHERFHQIPLNDFIVLKECS